MAFAVGAKFGRYEIRSKLGAGGMGEVYLAQDTTLDRKVALKILPPELAEDKDRMSRFVREAKFASALNHPNIITIHEIGEIDGTHFITTEFIEGETLKTRLERESLSLKSTLEIALQVASALDAAHKAGVVHRDIKPDNIMLSKAGTVKILDFGLARLGGNVLPDVEASGASGTISGTLSGTLPYMSPELLRGERASSASDVFSFASVLYELFTGRHPFAGETPLDVFEAIECRTPDAPSSRRPGIPSALDRLLLAMLAGEQEKRPSSPAVAVELDAIVFGE